MAFGKAEEPSPTFGVVCLHEITADIAESELLAADSGNVGIINAVPKPMMLRADPEQLFRIVMNLVRNARQAIAATGKPGQVTVEAREEADAWYVTVSDTGPGLPKRAQDNLFTRSRAAPARGAPGWGWRLQANWPAATAAASG